MIDSIWTTPFNKRQEFEDKFSRLVDPFISSYTGDQPVIAWNSDRVQPVIHQDFLNHLPDHLRQEVEKLMDHLGE